MKHCIQRGIMAGRNKLLPHLLWPLQIMDGKGSDKGEGSKVTHFCFSPGDSLQVPSSSLALRQGRGKMQ